MLPAGAAAEVVAGNQDACLTILRSVQHEVVSFFALLVVAQTMEEQGA